MKQDNQSLIELIEKLSEKEQDTAITFGVQMGLLRSQKYQYVYNTKIELVRTRGEVRLTKRELIEKYPNVILGIKELESQDHYFEAALLCESSSRKGLDRRAMIDYSIAGDYEGAFSKSQKANDPRRAKIYQSLNRILGSN